MERLLIIGGLFVLAAWREAVKVLDGFCVVADGLNHEPLILSLVDAKVRAEEELERAADARGGSRGVPPLPPRGGLA